MLFHGFSQKVVLRIFESLKLWPEVGKDVGCYATIHALDDLEDTKKTFQNIKKFVHPNSA